LELYSFKSEPNWSWSQLAKLLISQSSTNVVLSPAPNSNQFGRYLAPKLLCQSATDDTCSRFSRRTRTTSASWRSGRKPATRGDRALPSPPRREPRRGFEHRADTSSSLTRAHSPLPPSRSGRAHRGGKTEAPLPPQPFSGLRELTVSPPSSKSRPLLRQHPLHLRHPLLDRIVQR
jgi:hypothetical protein